VQITRLTALNRNQYQQAIKHLRMPKRVGAYCNRLGSYIWDHFNESYLKFDDSVVVYINGRQRTVHRDMMPALNEIYAVVEGLTPKNSGRAKKGKP
jgi:hypothetical protein